MQIGQQIEHIRQQENIPVFAVCNMLGLSSTDEYMRFVNGNIVPCTIHLIMFVESTHKALEL